MEGEEDRVKRELNYLRESVEVMQKLATKVMYHIAEEEGFKFKEKVRGQETVETNSESGSDY